MKILLLNQTFYPDNLATSQQIADLAQYLVQRGHQVSVIAGQRAYEERHRKFDISEKWRGIDISRVSSTGYGKGRLRYRLLDSGTFFISLIWKLIFFPSQDIVISFTSPPLIGAFGSLFCWFKGGRSVQWLMDINPDAAFQVGYLKRKSLLGRLLNFVFESTLKHASEVIVLDRWMKHRVIEHGALKERVIVVPPWSVFNENETDVEEAVREFKKEHGLENKFIVLYSGNHSVVHPLDTLLAAAKELRDREEIVFLFIGAGLRTQDVSRYKKENQLKNILQLPLQPREKVKASFGSADLHCVVMGPGMSGLVHTSKIYSVLASGKPFVFVGSERSHVGDLIRVHQVGKVVETREAKQLAQTVLDSQKLSQRVKEEVKAQSHAVVRAYSPDNNLRRFYQEVIETEESRTEESFSISSEPTTDEV